MNHACTIVAGWVEDFNTARPHSGINPRFQPPVDEPQGSRHGFALRCRLRLGELHRPARIPVFLPQLGRPGFPSLRHLAALIATFSTSVFLCLGATTIVAPTICPPMAR